MKSFLLVMFLLVLGSLLAGVALLSGCAGRVAGSPAWTQPPTQTPPQWDYGYPSGALLGRIVQQPDTTWMAYGCNNDNHLELTLLNAEQYVMVSCRNANIQKAFEKSAKKGQ